jgi:hypothetical protein
VAACLVRHPGLVKEFGVPRELTDEEKAARRKGRGGRKRTERTLAKLTKYYPSTARHHQKRCRRRFRAKTGATVDLHAPVRGS